MAKKHGLRTWRYLPALLLLAGIVALAGLPAGIPAGAGAAIGPRTLRAALSPESRVQGPSGLLRLWTQDLGLSTARKGPGAAGTEAPFDCSRIKDLGIDRQMNLRAASIMETCSGRAGRRGNAPSHASFAPVQALPRWGGADADAITGADTYPSVSQNESFVWAEGNTVVVSYNDSSAYPRAFQGISYSTDGGASFTRVQPSPLVEARGDPILVYNRALSTWFAGGFRSACGSQGIGSWTSPDGVN